MWVRAEYLLWWTEGFYVPPLVTTSPFDPDGDIDQQRDEAGVLGNPATSILFGGTGLANDARSGGRLRWGTWFNACRDRGIEVTYMGLGHDATRFSAESEGDPILARPFFNMTFDDDDPADRVQRSDSRLVAFPDLLEGDIEAFGKTTFQGVEVLYRHAIGRGCRHRLDLLAGWRFNRLDDTLSISAASTVLADQGFLPGGIPVVQGTEIFGNDLFETENRFNGFEMGLEAAIRRRRWTLELLTKLALGNSRSRVLIDGQALIQVPEENPQVVAAGLLAQESNIGVYENNEFAVIPELGIGVAYDLTCHLKATFGWSFIYWSRVARPGDQIDLDLNLSQLTEDGLQGLPRPEFRWIGDDVWIQGLNFGLDYRF
jgi:hypothetical protein